LLIIDLHSQCSYVVIITDLRLVRKSVMDVSPWPWPGLKDYKCRPWSWYQGLGLNLALTWPYRHTDHCWQVWSRSVSTL